MPGWCHVILGLVKPRSFGRRPHFSGVGFSLERRSSTSHWLGSWAGWEWEEVRERLFSSIEKNHSVLQRPIWIESLLPRDPSVVCSWDALCVEGTAGRALLVFSDGSQGPQWPSGCALATHTGTKGNAKKHIRNWIRSHSCSSGPRGFGNFGKMG